MITRPAAPNGPGVVSFAGLDWWYHNQAHADFQLALRLSKHRRVLVVNSIGTRIPAPGRSTQPVARIRRKLAAVARLVRRPRADLPDFYVYSPLTVPAYGSPWGRRLNAILLRTQLRLVTRWLRLVEPAVLVTPPTAWDVIATLPRSRLVFNRSDKHSAWAEVDQAHMEQLEERLLRTADAVLYVAHALMADDAPLVGDRAVFLDHGVDLQAFQSPGAEPADLAVIGRPRLGYLGALRDYTIDIDLLERLAVEIPSAQLVLVGGSTMDLTRLLALPNVHWLGQRPMDAVPAYCAGFDVALMPWLDNEWIRACNPIKMKEYLALGLPTVSTDFPEVHRYEGLIDIATDGDDFVRLVRAASASAQGGARASIRAANSDRRRAAVAHDSWDARAEVLATVLKKMTESSV